MSLVGSVVYAGSHPRVRIRLPELRRFEAETGEKFEREDDEVALIVNVVDRRYASASDGSAWETKRGRFREARGRLGLSHAARGKLDDYATRIWKDHETARESPHALLPNPSDEECDGSHVGPACGYDCPLFCGGRGGGGAECGCSSCVQENPAQVVGPLAYDPSTNRYSGIALARGDIVRDAKGNLYSVDRANGFILNVTALKDYGRGVMERSNEDRSFSVDPSMTKGPWAFVKLYAIGRNVFDSPPPSAALPNPTYVARDPFARGELRRESAGPGSCSWCGQQRRVLYTYEWESDDGRRFGPARGKFCGLPCFRSYHDVRANPERDEAPPPMVRFSGGRTCAPESKCPYCSGPMGWGKLTATGEDVWGCSDPTWKSCGYYYARPVSSSGKPYPCETDGCGSSGTVRLEDGSRVCPRHVPRKPEARIVRPNPHLILVTGNPAPGAVEKAWCKFHQRDSYDGRTVAFGTIKGMPSFVFALGKCKSVELDGVERTFKPQPWLVCAPDDDSLWIVTKDVMNLGSDAAGRKLTAITYDPTRESGKEPAYYRHEFDTPRPVMTPVGNPHKCRAVLLDGGAYTVSDWIHD